MPGQELALDDITMAVPAGECLGLFGVNGAGKTTVFQILAGNLTATSGSAFLDGYDVIALAKQVRVVTLRLPCWQSRLVMFKVLVAPRYSLLKM